ncbi:NAD(P)-binding protein [Karstenula rhodostoma CBS 690.94]|uniref:NAD(P)-binding protein n=1 Tax=Karstenula rhodostoma CBS 690.94 TaxID=1392251 RepID=A0A9P4P651_9PLEO|nr:NAD(P)-binding protein [Karstenula rhodostoma CBS 690.94]
MPQPPLRRILVSGATGKQGGALIAALTAHPTPPFHIYALTRNPKSRSAQALASNPNITLIQGDFSNPPAIFAQIPHPWGFFSVTNPLNAAREEAQGKAMTAAAIAAGVSHIVFSATDRGRDADTDATVVPHFASKFRVERDIVARAAESGGTYTILRPVAFFENLSDDFLGKGFVSMWRVNGVGSRIKFVSTRDIGRVAAEAFVGAGTEKYRNRAVALAGEDISLGEFESVFREETGRRLPETFGVVGRGLRWALREQLGIMFDWFESEGFGVDVGEVRGTYPFLKDFREWLRTESAWRKA